MDNVLNARIKLKYDTLTNWTASSATTPPFIPLAGEVCIAYITTNGPVYGSAEGTQTNQPRSVGIKVGDGTHKFTELPWIQAVAADVYNWAKAAVKPTYDATEIDNTSIQKKDVVLNSSSTANATVQEVLSWLKDQIDSMGGGAGSIATQIDNKINALDVDNDSTSSLTHHITGFGAGKTLATLTETNGYIAATFQDIQVGESQVTGASGGWITDGLAAKAPLASPALTGTPTAPTATAGTNNTQIATTAFVKDAVDTATAGLTGAMHFIGTSSTTITDGGTQNPTINSTEVTSKASGDVVLYDGKEYVWTGSAWEQLGDEASFALKTVSVSAGDGLSGGGNLTENRTISHATPTGAAAGTLGSTTDNSGRKYIQTLTTDKFGHVTGATYASESVTDNNTTYAFAAGDNDGEIKITATPNINGTAGTASSSSVKPKNLKTVATSGSAYDLNQVNTSASTNSSGLKFFILDCGTATTFIDNASAS